MATTLAQRTLDLDAIQLDRGAHDPDGKFCVMEAVAYVAGEPWSDKPDCACPIISAFLRRWNDDLNDIDRQMLKPFIPRLVGTKRTKKVEQQRGWLVADWMIRVYTPAWLELGGMKEQADSLRQLPPLQNLRELKASQPSINEARDAARAAAGVAAWDAAWDAARDAARDAAWDAARDAARDAAWDAARDAAGVAAWDAAGVAAWDAAWDAAGVAARDAARDAAGAAAWDAAGAAAGVAAGVAARAAAGVAARVAAGAAAGAAAGDAAGAAAKKKLEPTIALLQKSALELIDTLIACK